MGSNIPFRVKVLRLVEDEVEVYALTSEDALREASKLENVAKAIKVIYDDELLEGLEG